MKLRPHFALGLGLAFSSGCAGCESEGVVALIPIIEVEPMRLDLGTVPVGVNAQGVLTVRNRGEVRLDVSDVFLDSLTPFRISNEMDRGIEPSQSEALVIEARPTEVGMFETTLHIKSDDPERRDLEIPVLLNAIDQPMCDDGNACTEDRFDTDLNDCVHAFADGTLCQPADRCIINAVCDRGVCLGAPKSCNDQSPCTRDLCRQIDGECVFIENPTACEDNNPCTADACTPDGCEHVALPSGTPCDDGDLCTFSDTCFAGACVGNGEPDGSACDDQDSCTVGDTCRAGVCSGASLVDAAAEGEVVFDYPLTVWPERAFLHRREVSLSDSGVFYGLDHLSLPEGNGLQHVVFAMNQCGSEVYQFAYRPPDTHVLVSAVRRSMQIGQDERVRMVVGIRQQPDFGYEPQTTTYLLDRSGGVLLSGIQTLGGETGRSLLPDGSHIFGVIWPLSFGPPTMQNPAIQNLVVVREDISGNPLWRHERTSGDWAEFLGVAGPRVLFWALGRFGALDFNTGATVWSQATPFITKEMALSTDLNLGVARASNQLIGVEILQGRHVFSYPPTPDLKFIPRTDPVIAADGRILVMMETRAEDLTSLGLSWVELSPDGDVLHQTPLPYVYPPFGETRHEDFDDPYPTVADDGISYVGYGDTFWAIDPGGNIRWTITSTVESAFTGTVPLLRDDGILLISEQSRRVIGIRTNGGRMSAAGWASFRHDGDRTNYTP